jgi:hypothetical protein
MVEGSGVDSFGSECGPLAGSCEHGNEPSSFATGVGKFLNDSGACYS